MLAELSRLYTEVHVLDMFDHITGEPENDMYRNQLNGDINELHTNFCQICGIEIDNGFWLVTMDCDFEISLESDEIKPIMTVFRTVYRASRIHLAKNIMKYFALM